MIVKTKKGFFKILKNVKDSFNLEKFEEYYIEELFDSYPYVVGDISDEKLRLKGFSEDPKSNAFYKTIPDYILESCNYQTPYYILKKTTEEEYEAHKYDKPTELEVDFEPKQFIIEKVPFDKDNLKLSKSKKNTPRIVIDSVKMNQIKSFELPPDLKEEVIKAKIHETSQRKFQNKNRNNQKNNNNKNNTNNRNNTKNNKQKSEAKVFEHVNSKQ